MKDRTAMLFGGTGLVGGHLIQSLLSDDSCFKTVISVGRRHLDFAGAADSSIVEITWESLDDGYSGEGIQALTSTSRSLDSVFIALGTTIRKAGSRDAFRKIDLDLVVHAAGSARRLGAKQCYLVSSLGADERSRLFYNRVKGEAEEAVARLGFERLCIFRPSLLLGDRREKRTAEALGQRLGRLAGPMMIGSLARYRPILAADVARAMLNAARLPKAEGSAEATVSNKRLVFESEQIRELARIK